MICRLIGDDEAREFFAKDLKAAAAIGVDGKSRRSWALRQEQASQSGSNLLLQPSGSGLSALAEDQSDIEYDDDDSEIQLDAMQSVSGKARQRRKTNTDMPPVHLLPSLRRRYGVHRMVRSRTLALPATIPVILRVEKHSLPNWRTLLASSA